MSKAPEYFIAFVVCILFWFVLLGFTGTLKSGFHLIDDHEVIRINHDFNEGNGLIHTIEKWVKSDLKIRLRSFFYVHRIIEVYFLRLNSFSMAIYIAFLAGVTSWLLYLFARTMQLSSIESSLFVLFTLVGAQSEIWWRLGVCETIGMCLLALSLVLNSIAAKQKKSNLALELAAIFFTFLASQSKESFILMLPSIVLIRIWLSKKSLGLMWQQALKHNLISVLTLMTIFVIEIVLIVFYVGSDKIGYAGLMGFTLHRFYDAFLSLTRINHFNKFILFLAFLAVFIPAKSTFHLLKNAIDLVKTYWFEFVIFLSVTIPQCILYTKSGFQARYFVPASLGCAYFLMVFISSLRKKNLLSSPLRALTLAVLFYSILDVLGGSVIPAADAFTTAGMQTSNLMKRIVTETNPDSQITILADPALHYEYTFSLDQFLEKSLNRKKIEIEIIRSQKAYNAYQSLLFAQFNELLKEKPLYQNRETKLDSDCIIVFPNIEHFVTTPLRSRIDLQIYKRLDYELVVLYCKKAT